MSGSPQSESDDGKAPKKANTKLAVPLTVLKAYAHLLGEQQTIGGLRRLNELASGPKTLATSSRTPTRTGGDGGI
ncbi:hypothetical protein [Rathayibacter toxicus]|uniref:hypothetical protein n=1 Tax=Rathayibacter toxicus TaxID=145458 RepID=UPI001C046AFA|nr:hypothetical protein [Rathayibacter toxicus]QWL30915.1 hypothetical protein E2R34_09285 [Rathayibacter toxicus]